MKRFFTDSHTLFLFSLTSVLLFSGCFSEQKEKPNQSLLKVQEHYLNMRVKEAQATLEELSKQENLPEQYFDLGVKVSMRGFQFEKALEYLKAWEKSSSREMIQKRREIYLAYLRYQLDHPNLNIRFEAIKAVGELGDKKSAQLLMDAFPVAPLPAKLTICYAMTLLGDGERALPYLQDRSQYGKRSNRALAALLLTELEDESLLDSYLRLLDDSEDAIRVMAIRVLGKFQSQKARNYLRSLYDLTSSPQLRLLLASSLYQMGDTEVRSFLEKSLNSRSRARSTKILFYQMGEKRWLEELLKAEKEFSSEERFALFSAMIENSENEKVLARSRELSASIMGELFDTRIALDFLGSHGKKEDLSVIEGQFASPFTQVKVGVAKAMIDLIDRHYKPKSS